MGRFFYNLGRKFGSSLVKGKWYYQSVFGSEEEAIQAEQLVGKEMMLNVSKENTVIQDPSKKKVVNQVSSRLCSRVTNPNRKFKFYILSSSDVNAFALPGGYICVTESLLDLVQYNQHEVAFILSHEMIHVLYKHPMNRIVANFSSQIISNIIVKGGALGVLAKRALADLVQKSYSRDKEFEADSTAVRLMYSAGFDPNFAKQMLAKLEKYSPENLPVYHYFLSHPSIPERLQNIDSIIEKYQMNQSNE
jgi:predicted Zn-dependent protease